MIIDGFRLSNAVVAEIKKQGLVEDVIMGVCKIGEETKKRFYQQCSINERDARSLCNALGLNVYSFVQDSGDWNIDRGRMIKEMGFEIQQDDEEFKHWRKCYDQDKMTIGMHKSSCLWFVELMDHKDRPIYIADMQPFERAFVALKLTDAVMRVRSE